MQARLPASASTAAVFARVVAALLLVLALGLAQAAEPSGEELVAHVEQLLWGQTSQGAAEMTIVTPRWQRSLKLRFWMDRPDRSFIRILSPPKEAGIGSLRIRSEMWNYLPSIERTIKIPPSMMLQPWMGSDLTNDDLVKESSAVEDYTHRLTGRAMQDGVEVYVVESTPRPDAAVVWGKLVYRIRVDQRLPLRQEYYDERGVLVKVMTLDQVRELDGRLLPTHWVVRPLAKPGNRTEFRIDEMRFDRPIDAEIFTLGNLQRQR